MVRDFHPIGPGRFRVSLRSPWGQRIPAEMVLSTRRGWPHRREAREAGWAAFPVGPLVIGLRLGPENAGIEPTPPWDEPPTRSGPPLDDPFQPPLDRLDREDAALSNLVRSFRAERFRY